jgi:hypothetical protein
MIICPVNHCDQHILASKLLRGLKPAKSSADDYDARFSVL